MAGALCLLAGGGGAQVTTEQLAARGWSALMDGPVAMELTKGGQLLPRFRPPGVS